MQQNTAPWCLFNSTTKKVSNINITLRHSLLEVTGKRLGEKKVQFNCFDRFYIRGFDNIQHQDYNKTQWRDPLSGVW